MERVAILFDDPFQLENLKEKFCRNWRSLSDYSGMSGYEVLYKNKRIFLFFSFKKKELLFLRLEELLSEHKFDLFIHLGNCCFFSNSEIPDFKFVSVSEAKWIGNTSSLLDFDSGDLQVRNPDLDSEELIFSFAKNKKITLVSVSCYSFDDFSNRELVDRRRTNCLVFDDRSFFIYSLFDKYNTPIVCLKEVRIGNFIDINHFLEERRCSESDFIAKFVLDFSVSCQ